MRRPCETVVMIQRADGRWRNTKHFSYVAVLTEIGGNHVQAVRYDGYTSKEDGLIPEIEQDYPGWKIKGVWKLYDSDFREEE